MLQGLVFDTYILTKWQKFPSTFLLMFWFLVTNGLFMSNLYFSIIIMRLSVSTVDCSYVVWFATQLTIGNSSSLALLYNSILGLIKWIKTHIYI